MLGCFPSGGSKEWSGRARPGARNRGVPWSRPLFLSFASLLILSACASKTPYPDLNSVASSPETAAALKERRQIVRDLIEDRDHARHNKAVIRHRSGLSDVPPPKAPVSTAIRPEDIVRSEQPEADVLADQALQIESERAYRGRAQFDDGTLNDFIRNLKKDTAPSVDDPAADDQEGAPGQPDGLSPQSWLFEKLPSVSFAGAMRGPTSLDQPLILAAFAPSAVQDEGVTVVRLAADDADPGFLCTYLGWMVAWSDACLEAGEEGGAADDALEDQPLAESDETATDETGSSDREREVLEPRRSRPEDEVVASEDIDSSGSSLIAGPLDRLRNLLRSRSPPSEQHSTDPRSLSYEAEALRPPKDMGPPLPRSRPDVERDLRIVRNQEVFEFTRTPRPAFKPVQKAENTVIFPPLSPRSEKKTSSPTAKPKPVAAEQSTTDDAAPSGPSETGKNVAALGDLNEAKSSKARKSAASTGTGKSKTAVSDSAESADPSLLDSEIVAFAPGSVDPPVGIEGRLGSMLRKAKAKGGKLMIVSEAETGSLAMERARSIGLALVQLGATADLIDYDIVIDDDLDRLTLLLRLPQATVKESTQASDLDKPE